MEKRNNFEAIFEYQQQLAHTFSSSSSSSSSLICMVGRKETNNNKNIVKIEKEFSLSFSLIFSFYTRTQTLLWIDWEKKTGMM